MTIPLTRRLTCRSTMRICAKGVALAQRAIPNHFDVDAVAGMEVVGRTHGATVDRLPELVRHSLWNDGNPIIGRNAIGSRRPNSAKISQPRIVVFRIMESVRGGAAVN